VAEQSVAKHQFLSDDWFDVVGKLVEEHKKKKTLDEKPLRFDLAKFREGGDTPLFFPGKVVADEAGKRLFIADSTHHRIVVTDLDGNAIAGMLDEIFGADMTQAVSTCAGCGRTRPVRSATAWRPPGGRARPGRCRGPGGRHGSARRA